MERRVPEMSRKCPGNVPEKSIKQRKMTKTGISCPPILHLLRGSIACVPGNGCRVRCRASLAIISGDSDASMMGVETHNIGLEAYTAGGTYWLRQIGLRQARWAALLHMRQYCMYVYRETAAVYAVGRVWQ